MYLKPTQIRLPTWTRDAQMLKPLEYRLRLLVSPCLAHCFLNIALVNRSLYLVIRCSYLSLAPGSNCPFFTADQGRTAPIHADASALRMLLTGLFSLERSIPLSPRTSLLSKPSSKILSLHALLSSVQALSSPKWLTSLARAFPPSKPSDPSYLV